MNEILQNPDLIGILLLGVGGAFLGLLGLLERSGRWWQSPGMWVALAFALAAAGLAAAGQPATVWGIAALLAAVDLFVRLARHYRQMLAMLGRGMLQSRRLPAAVLLCAAPLLAFGWSYQISQEDAGHDLDLAFPESNHCVDAIRPADAAAMTDRGRTIQLYRYDPDVPKNALDSLRRSEEQIGKTMSLHLIRMAAPDPNSNCFGWVFTFGHFCLKGGQIANILADNAYERESLPRPGDVVIYRCGESSIVHAGLVRVVENSLILIESKWGSLGRYLHTPEDQPYSQDWTYYRSARHGHLLLGDWQSPSDPNSPIIQLP